MGVNLFWADPIEDAKCVGFAREFHDWRTDQNDSEFIGPVEGIPTESVYPEECYAWNPTHSGVIDFDFFYSTLIANGMTVSPSMNNTILPFAGYKSDIDYYFINDDFEMELVAENMDGDDICVTDTCAQGSYITRKPVEWAWVWDPLFDPTHPNYDPLAVPFGEWSLADPSLTIDDLNFPAPYAPRANWVYNFMANYGSGAVLNSMNSSHLKYCEVEPPTLGQGMIQYVECWNEPTKDWYGDEENFTPEQYAAMANCDYDGWDGTKPVGEQQIYILDETGASTNVPMGIKHLYTPTQLQNGELKFVMGAPHLIVGECLEGPDLPDCDGDPMDYVGLNLEGDCAWNVWTNWIMPMESRLDELRDGLVEDDHFIFDVVNVHHYSGGKNDLYEFDWFSPEEDELRLKMQWLRDKMNGNGWTDKELWLSEFGYDTDDSDVYWNFPDIAISAGLTPEDLQAQWIIRSYLELAAAGVDRAIVHDLKDSNDGTGGAWDGYTGLLLLNGNPKKSWYYSYTMKNILTGFNYIDDASSSDNCWFNKCDVNSNNECTRVYKFQNGVGETIWAVWSPTSENIAPYSFPLTLSSGTTAATAISLVAPSINGVSEELQIDDATGIVNVMVSETPIFIVEEALVAPTCPIIIFDESSCTSISVEVDLGTQSIDGYHIWYGEASEVNDPPNFSALNNELTYFGYDLQTNPTTENSISVSGLEPNTEYTIFIIPETEAGIPASISIPQPGENTCSITASTSSSIGICKIPVGDPQVVSIIPTPGGDNDLAAEDRLFDEQNDFDFCSASGPEVVDDPNAFFVNFIGQSSGVQSIILEFLQENYFMEQFHFYDGSGSGLFKFEWSNTNNGTDWAVLSNYYTAPLNEWVTISNFDQPQNGIRYLRLTATTPSARLRELYICGTSVCGLDIDGVTEDCSSATINVTPPLGACMADLIVTEQSDLTGGITIPVVQSTIQIPPSPVTFGDALIPNITYYVGSNPQGDQLSFTTATAGTGCIQGAQIQKEMRIACPQAAPGSGNSFPGFSPRIGFFIPANIPANYRMQFWLSAVPDGTIPVEYSTDEHPLVTDPTAEMRIVQPGAVIGWPFLGFYRPVVITDLLGEGFTYTFAYRYITETESSELYTSTDYATTTPFTFVARGCPASGGTSSFAGLINVDCDVVGAYHIETETQGTYEFSERANKSNTPTLGALAFASIPATGEDIYYAFQESNQIKYIYWRWTDGISPDPWEYMETDFDPCAPVVGKSDDSDISNKQSFAKIYPNPTKAILNLVCDDCMASELFSIDGRKLPLHLIKQSTNNYQFDTSQLPDGMYFIQITNSAGEREALRFVVQR